LTWYNYAALAQSVLFCPPRPTNKSHRTSTSWAAERTSTYLKEFISTMFAGRKQFMISAVLCTLLAMPVQAQSAVRPGVNLLTNPSHEHPGVYFGGRGEINVTWNWTPFWEEPPPGADPRDQNYRTPEFRPPFAHDYPYRVRSGSGSDRWFNYFALNKKAGIMQYIEKVPVGSPMRFTSWLQLWSSNDNDPAIPPKSTRDGNLLVRVCIDQDGGPRNMEDPELKCSDWAQPYDKWAQLSVDGVAKNSVVNVLIWSTASIPVEHNDVYADDSCAEILTSPTDKGICLGASYIPTGEGIQAASQNAAGVQPGTAPATNAIPASTRKAAAPIRAVVAPTGTVPALAINSPANVREKPARTAKIITTVARGVVLPVSGKSADGAWYQVNVKGKAGWVLGALTRPNAAAKKAPVVQ
jgi:hypothetical protein